MNILIAFHPVGQLGGLLNHTEHLTQGLKECGHKVHFTELVWKEKARSANRDTSSRPHEWAQSNLGEGYQVHQSHGWDGVSRFPYKGEKNLRLWREYAEVYDLIIWEVPVPTRRNDNKGNSDWPELYNLHNPKQIAIIHDGNMPKAYPHLIEVTPYLDGLVCVHPAAYNSAKGTGLPQIMLVNPFDLSKFPSDFPAYDKRKKGFNAFQTFKGWKHVEDVVRAVPHLPKGYVKQIAGRGVQYSYMATATDKMPPEFIDDGVPIWKSAVANGMDYLGVITEAERDRHMRRIRTFVDPSWSKAYAAHDSHFNRTTIETMLNGGIPIARDLGIGGLDKTGVTENFHPINPPDDLHTVANSKQFLYQRVPYDCTGKEFAEYIKEANNFPGEVAKNVIYHNRALAEKMFDSRKIAEKFIRFARGKVRGISFLLPALNNTIKEDAEKSMEFFQS